MRGLHACLHDRAAVPGMLLVPQPDITCHAKVQKGHAEVNYCMHFAAEAPWPLLADSQVNQGPLHMHMLAAAVCLFACEGRTVIWPAR